MSILIIRTLPLTEIKRCLNEHWKTVRKDANTQKFCWDKKRSFTTRLGQGKAGAAFHEIPPTDFFS